MVAIGQPERSPLDKARVVDAVEGRQPIGAVGVARNQVNRLRGRRVVASTVERVGGATWAAVIGAVMSPASISRPSSCPTSIAQRRLRRWAKGDMRSPSLRRLVSIISMAP